MTSHEKLEGFSQLTSPAFRRTVRDTAQDHRGLLWLVCAAISLLSARHLLVEQNFHYPLQLFLNQITATATIALISRRKDQAASERGRWRVSTMQGTLLVAGAHCFTVLSLFCTMQAILHFTNLPVLVMLTTIAFFAEGLVLFIAGFTSHSRVELVRLSLLVLASAGILITEYRLRVPNLIFSILAMLFAGVASALRKLAIKYHPGHMADQNASRWLVGMSVLIATAWLLSPWARRHEIIFDLGSVPLLVVNACFTAVALLMGNSIIFPMDVPSGRPSKATDAPPQLFRDVFTLLALTGILGCSSTLSLSRSYINWYQFWSFVLAILCIGGKAVYDTDWSSSKLRWDRGRIYELTHSSVLESDESEATAFVEEVGVSELQAPSMEARGISLRAFLISIALGVVWTTYLLLNFMEQEQPRIHAILDRDYQPTVPIEVVLSMYEEPIDDVVQLISSFRSIPKLSEAHFTIYTKDVGADEQWIKEKTKASRVIALPNVGREGETYLNHILTRWDSLASQTIFLQADIHNPREFYPRLDDFFWPNQTGFLGLGWSGTVCNCEDCGDKFSWRDDTHLLPDIQSRINNSSTCQNVLLNYKGQFIVSAARIRGIDKSIYHDLRQAFVDENSWAHQQEYLQGRTDSMSEPWFGYTMERMWSLLFQCSDMQVAWKCPSLLSGWRLGGDIGDCQCFDSQSLEMDDCE